MKKGFTMAEVLITLGILGVVIAMTLPGLMEGYEKKVTANKLKKFYTVMMQAIMLAENVNGELQSWMPTQDQVMSGEGLEDWYNMYLDKHISSLHKEVIKSNGRDFQVTFLDGSGFNGYISSTKLIYFMYCTDIKYCGIERYDGRHSFLFSIASDYPEKFFASAPSYKQKTRELLLDSCAKGNADDPLVSIKDKRHACARLIQYDGWEIKKDYPWRQIMIDNRESED